MTRSKGAGGTNTTSSTWRTAARSPDECGLVLNAIIDSYKDFLDETYRNMSDDTLELVTKARDVLQRTWPRRKRPTGNSGRTPPLLTKGKDGNHLRQDRLAGIETEAVRLLLRRAETPGPPDGHRGSAASSGVERQTLLAMTPTSASRADADNGPRRTQAGYPAGPAAAAADEEQKLLETLRRRTTPRSGPCASSIQVDARPVLGRGRAAGARPPARPRRRRPVPARPGAGARRSTCRQQLNHAARPRSG